MDQRTEVDAGYISTIGYTWEHSRPVVPCIVSALYYECWGLGLSGRLVNSPWVLDYTRSFFGKVRVGSVRSRWQERAAHIAHLYPPQTPYWEHTSKSRIIKDAFINFNGGTEAGLEGLIPRRCKFARFLDPGARIEPLLLEAATAGQSMGDAGFWKAQAALCSILQLLQSAVHQTAETFLIPATEPGPSPDDFAMAVDDYLRQHLSERITLDVVARHLHVSPSTLSHRYSKQRATSPMYALTSMRINLARTLLLRGFQLDAIASRTGFCDAYHLSKTFKKRVGLSPRDFRRSLLARHTPQ